MSDAESRLAQIHNAYFDEREGAAKAVTVFDTWQGALSQLLRYHRRDPITSEAETWERDNFDSLLSYFSMVEIACLAGWLPARLPDSHTAMAARILDDVDVRRYYEHHYPILLPQAHRNRVNGQGIPLDSGAADDRELLFEEFFTLSQPIETGDEVETFLWFLDGGSRGGFDINDTINALRFPESFLEHSSALGEDSSDGKLSALSASVQGFLAFADFAPRLLHLLEETSQYPKLQSGMWHFHGYWLRQMGDRMGSEVRRGLSALSGWNMPDFLEIDSWKQSLDAEVQRVAQERALTRLSSGRYSYVLVEELLSRPRSGSGSDILIGFQEFDPGAETEPAMPAEAESGAPAEEVDKKQLHLEDEEYMT